MDEVKTKTENEVNDDNVKKGEPNNKDNEGTKPIEVETNGHEPNADNIKKGESNEGMKPVEVENIESNDNDAKDNMIQRS